MILTADQIAEFKMLFADPTPPEVTPSNQDMAEGYRIGINWLRNFLDTIADRDRKIDALEARIRELEAFTEAYKDI